MPHSSAEGKWWAAERLRETAMRTGRPVLVIDVGAGGGSWLDILYPALQDLGIPQQWAAVEAWHPYIDRFLLRERYGYAVQADARVLDFAAIRSSQENELRVAVFGDVLEHMPAPDAIAMVERALECSDFVIMALPTIHYPQGAVLDNPYEVHQEEDWTLKRMLDAFPSITAVRPGQITSCFIIDKTIPDVGELELSIVIPAEETS